MNDVELRRSRLRRLSQYEKLAAIVAYGEPTEKLSQHAPCTLTVTGVVQPGGG